MILKLKDICASYPDGFQALENVNASIETKSFVVILGESGSGKTSLLNVIAGLLDPSTGSVSINDKDVTNLLTESRDLSMIFQNYVLYPHMTVYGNVMMGLNGFAISEDEKDKLAKQILAEFGLANYLNFKPRHISDGQKQRVAMCKALVRDPQLFLMDEPLSNLDLPQRVRIKKELKDIYERYNTSFIYITHDLMDAEMLSTQVWIMDYGTIIQTGTLSEIRKNPRTLKAFQLVYGGEINMIPAKYENGNLSFLNQSIKFDSNKKGGEYTLACSYSDFFVSKDGPFEGLVSSIKVTSKGLILHVKINESEVCCYYDDSEVEINEGDLVRLQIKSNNIKLFKSSRKADEVIG